MKRIDWTQHDPTRECFTRRKFLQTLGTAGAALTLTGLTGYASAAALDALAGAPARRKPNIVLILVDDLGWRDLGCYGSTFYETPAIDRLAREGMRFTDAYSNCPVCSPSRAALMTGEYPARLRFTGHITATGRHRHPENSRIIPPDDRMYLPLEEVTIAEALKPAGYVSGSFGKWHLGGEGYWPESQGFDKNVGGWTQGSPPTYFYPYVDPKSDWNPSIPGLEQGKPGEYLTDRLTDEAIQFMRENRDRPFFVYLTHYAVHTPIEAPGPLIAKYKTKLKTDGSQINPTYAAMIDSVDQNVARVTRAIDELGLTDDTVVIVYSDNGGLADVTRNAPLRAGKGHLYEGGIRVPLIVKWPGRVRGGAVCGAPVIGSDLYPTLMQIVGDGVRPGETIDGLSLVPLLEGAERLDRGDRALFWYYPHYSPQKGRPGAAVREGDYKLIECYDPPGVELYKIGDDIGEQNNLAGQMGEKTAELLRKLHQWLESVHAKRHTLNPAGKG